MRYLLFFLFFSSSVIAENNLLYLNYEQDSILFKNTMDKALSFFRVRKLDSFKKYSSKSYLLSNKPKDLQEVHFYLATYYKFKQIPDSAYYHYHQSRNILFQLGDTIMAGRRLFNVANIQFNQNYLLASEISYIESLKYLEKTNLNSIKYKIYAGLGKLSQQKKDIKEALKYYDLSLHELKKDSLPHTDLHLNIMNLKGVLYQCFNQHKKAIPYFKKGLAFNNIKEKYPSQYGSLLENLAYSSFQLGKKINTLNQYKEVLKIREELKDFSGAAIVHINISNYYEDIDKNKALYHSNKALTYAKQTHSNTSWLNALTNLAYLTKGVQSRKYLQQYINLNDSLFDKERKLKNQFAKIRYETDKKEKENVVLKSENEKKQVEIIYHKQQKTIGWLAAASGLLLFGLSILFFIFRRKKLLYRAQIDRVQAREHERQQIAKSLHDEVAGDLRLLHQKLEKSNLFEEAKKLDTVKENVRNLSHQLSSISFDKVSFKDQIINLVSDYYELDFKIKVSGLKEYNWLTINDAIKRLLYLSIRESIQNCKKYANASRININLSIQKNYVLLSIIDNGIGFDTTISKKGIGLQNLQERVEELNGTLDIKSEVGKGTQTSIQIPLNAWTNKNTLS